MNLVPWLLFLHVLGAIVAFGPTFAYSVTAGMGAKEPQHSLFGLRVNAAIGDKIVYPLAAVQGITGVLLIVAAGWNLTAPGGRWLITSIVLYVIALGFATAVQRKRVHTLIDLLSNRPKDAPAGPPPAPALALIKSIQQGGIILTVLIVAIILLMVLKPTM